MKRVAIVVEGDTEVEFVKQVLEPHLEAHGDEFGHHMSGDGSVLVLVATRTDGDVEPV